VGVGSKGGGGADFACGAEDEDSGGLNRHGGCGAGVWCLVWEEVEEAEGKREPGESVDQKIRCPSLV